MFIDVQIREHEHGDIKYKGNGKLVEELSHIIAKYGLRSQVLNNVLEYEKEEMLP